MTREDAAAGTDSDLVLRSTEVYVISDNFLIPNTCTCKFLTQDWLVTGLASLQLSGIRNWPTYVRRP